MSIEVLMHNLAAIKNNPLVWAQGDHFFIALSTLLLMYREGMRSKFWYVGICIFVWALGVEIWYDPRYEGDPFFCGGLLDLAFYASGVLVGLAIDYGWRRHRLTAGMS